VPESWVWVSGFDIFKPMTSKKPTNGTFTYIDINAIDNSKNCIVNPKVLEASNAPSRASREVKSGDTLFSMVRPYLMNIAYVDNQYKNSIASTGFFVCRPNELLFPKFLYYLMLSPFVVYGLNSFMKGDNSPSINNDNIISFQYPLPPLLEQYRIVDKIEKLFDLIYLINENKLSLEQYITQTKSKVLDLAIRGKLVPQDPEEEPASMLLKKIRKDDKIKRVSSDTSHYPFEIPSSWAWCKLGDIFEIKSSKRVLKSEWRKSGVPFFRAREVVKLAENDFVDNELFISQEHYLDLKKKYGVPKENDLLISAVGTIGKTYIVKNTDIFYYKDASVLCLSNIYSINPFFIKIVLATNFIQFQMYKNSKGTTVDTITIEKLINTLFPLPPQKEQQRIVEKVEEIFMELDQIKKNLQTDS
jgi:type I restriction enzyme S subunit